MYFNIYSLEVSVLDISKFQLSLTRSILSQMGVRRIRVSDQLDAVLDALLTEPSGLLIVDSKLPEGMPCLRLVRRLRSPVFQPLCFMPIIVTSTAPTDRFVESAIRNGANYVVAKPFSLRVLQQRIQRVIADNDKLELKDDRYVLKEMIDSMEARALCANPAMFAALRFGGVAPEGGDAPSTRLDRQTLIEMLRRPDDEPLHMKP
jgi:DNA-binding response OmpR family regulator